MVLIAIDKHSRKILGYLCKNDQTVAYCCSDCDVEFTKAIELEHHMVSHERLPSERVPITLSEDITAPHVEIAAEIVAEIPAELPVPVANDEKSEASSEGDIPLKVLSEIEKDNFLRKKYQVSSFGKHETFLIFICL